VFVSLLLVSFFVENNLLQQELSVVFLAQKLNLKLLVFLN
jgi:hypothetical protein